VIAVVGKQTIIRNRLGWARTYMKKAGLIEHPKHGVFRITARGKQVLGDKPERIDVQYLEKFPEFIEFRSIRRDKGIPVVRENDTKTPEEALDAAYEQPLDREKILDEALLVFARHGFRKASIGDIVRPLGVGKTAIYHHFPGGKNEIIDSCLVREEEAVLASMRAAVESHEDPRDQLRALVAAKFEHIQRLRAVLKISGEVGHEIGRLYRQHERRFTLHEESLIETIIRRGQEMGIFRPADPQRLARGLRGLLAHFEIKIAFDSGTESRQDQFDTVFDLIFHGLVGTDQREGNLQ